MQFGEIKLFFYLLFCVSYIFEKETNIRFSKDFLGRVLVTHFIIQKIAHLASPFKDEFLREEEKRYSRYRLR